MFPYKAVHVWVRKYMTHPGLNVSKTQRPSLQGKDLRYRNVVIPSGDWSGSSLITSVFKHYVLHRNKKKKKKLFLREGSSPCSLVAGRIRNLANPRGISQQQPK